MQISLRGQVLRTHTNAHPYSMKQQNLPLTTANNLCGSANQDYEVRISHWITDLEDLEFCFDVV